MWVVDLDAQLAKLSPEQLAELDRLLVGVPPRVLYRDWLAEHFPRWRWDSRYHRYLIDKLQWWYDTPGANLGLVAPVRHGKSELVTRRFPAYGLSLDPTQRWVFGGYTATFVRFHANRARRHARQVGVVLDESKGAVNDWETTRGGGLVSVGVGEGVTGRGADFIIVDDPVKSREDAESEVFRQKVWDWFNDDLLSRKEPGCRSLVTMARWHEDDLVGRIQASEYAHEWEWVRLPALAEEHDPLGRYPGEALWPERFNEDALASIRLRGEYGFASLYQGHPVPRTGNMFPADKVRIVDEAPAGPTVRYWDQAGTEDAGAYSTGVKMRYADKRFWVLDVVRARVEAHERKQLQRRTAEMDGVEVKQWVEQEPGSGGKEQAQEFVRLLAGFSAHYETVTGDKVTRADPWAAQWQAGNVALLRGEWNAAYIREHGSFPLGRFKDQVDPSAGACNKLARTPKVGDFASLVKESHWSL